jgi:phosphonate transport system substrate-binding protein
MNRKLSFSLIIAISVISIATVTFTQNAEAQSMIPDWIKTNAGWWANDEIDDQTFLNGIEFLVEEGIINVSSDKLMN